MMASIWKPTPLKYAYLPSALVGNRFGFFIRNQFHLGLVFGQRQAAARGTPAVDGSPIFNDEPHGLNISLDERRLVELEDFLGDNLPLHRARNLTRTAIDVSGDVAAVADNQLGGA